MERSTLFSVLIAIALISGVLFAQIRNPVFDNGTPVAMGKMVKLNSSGQILVCGDNDPDVAGVVVAVQNIGGTNRYLIASSDVHHGILGATVNAGDRLTTSLGGNLRTASPGDLTVGYALENGDGTNLKKVIFFINRVSDWNSDTLGAYRDTLNRDFQRLRSNANPWLYDSVTFVAGAGVTLSQTGDSITIAAIGGGGADNDWERNDSWTGNRVYTFYNTDSVGIGTTTPTAKLDVDGGITMRNGRFTGRNSSGADTFQIYISGDTTFIKSEKRIKIGNPVNTHISDSLYFGKVAYDTLTDSVLVLGRGGKVGWASWNDVGGAITQAYGELQISIRRYYSGVTKSPNWQNMDSCECGFYSGLPYVTVTCVNGQLDTIIVGPKGNKLYQMSISISFDGASGLILELGVFVNNVLLDKFTLFSQVASTGEKKSASLSGLLKLNPGDKVTVKFRDTSGGGAKYMNIYNFNLQITRIDDA